MFVDRVKINVRGGHGGAGAAAFLREPYQPGNKPDGGDGGRGGDVWLEATTSVSTLLRFTKQVHHVAPSGTHGSGKARHGKTGPDIVVLVPLGTSVYDDEGVLLADLVQAGDRVKVANGGRGGRGNMRFVTSSRRTPSFAEQGEYGDERWITLELRLIADVALVGFPNAGKSTLISRISAAKPKIADYPFTTLEPHLGVVSFDDREFVVADIPGLIEGASEGRGLGHEFLRHIERARVLLYCLDPLQVEEISTDDQLAVLRREVKGHSAELASRPSMSVITKADAAPAGEVSAVTGAGIRDLLGRLAEMVDLAAREAPTREGYVLHRPAEESWRVEQHGRRFVVTGRPVERVVAMADLTNQEAANYVRDRLRRLGVEDALRKAGAREGDEVAIGGMSFEWSDADA
jgi:GTP-binding protein